jgi:AcrR family transcriptional regulator
MCARTGGHVGPPPLPYFAEFIEGRRGEILDAALAVFGEKGYEAGTMREIAKRVGVTEPAIYRHYESKEAILADIVATAGDRISGEMRAALDTVSGENVVPMLHALIAMRRRDLGVGSAAATEDATVGADRVPAAFRSRAGGVMHMLFHAAPHNATFIGLLRAHLGKPMAEAVRATIPRIDESFGILRTQEDLDAKIRVFMSLFAGYFTTSLFFDAPPNDSAIVEAMLAIMGWRD